MKRGTLFKKWFFSYLIIVFVALLFSFGIYNLYGRTMEKEINKLNNAYLNQIKTLIDGEMGGVQHTTNLVGLSTIIQTVISMDKDLTIKDRYVLQDALKKISIYNISNDFINGIYLYVFSPDMLMTSESVYTDYMDLFTTEKFGVDAERFRRIMKRNYQKEIVRFNSLTTDKEASSDVYYIQSLPINYKSSMFATLFVELNETRINDFLGNKDELFQGLICILDSQNRVIFSSGNLAFPTWLKYEDLEDDQVLRKTIQGEKVVVSSLESDITDFKFIRIVPENLFWREAGKLRNSTILIIFALALVGILLAYLFTRRNYSPLNEIVRQVIIGETEKLEVNEYEYIQNAIEQNYELQKQMKYQINRQNRVLKNNFLIQLLKGKIENNDEIKQQLDAYDIKFNENYYVVMIFQIHDLSMFMKGNSIESEFRLARFIIQNIFEEIMVKKFNCTMVELDDLLVCILNIGDQCKEQLYPELLAESIQEAYLNITSRFNIDYTVAISYEHQSILGISEAYREALDALAYTKILGNVETIFYGDILQTKRKYDYPIEKEHQFINLIMIGHYNEAKNLLDEILDKHLKEELLSVETIQCLVFDLLSSIIKTINGVKEQQILDEIRPMKKMMTCKSVDDMKSVLDNVLYKVCELKKQQLDEEEDNQLSKRVKEFILKNYHDPNLNVSMLGEQFNITPAYLSKLYRQDTGDSLLNTINRIRINHAKTLLEETDCTVGEIAMKVGYTYSNAFIRVFKKYEGVTPGQYKSVL